MNAEPDFLPPEPTIDPTLDRFFVIDGVDSKGRIYNMVLTNYPDAIAAAKESNARLIKVKDSLKRPCGTITIEHGGITFSRDVVYHRPFP